MVSNKHPFWQALISAILIFGIGLLVGLYIENYRNQGVENNYIESEINILDSQILGTLGSKVEVPCDIRKESLINFADKIYLEANQMEDLDASSQLTTSLEVIHKKYDLLRIILLMETIDFKSSCNQSLNNLVYIYQYKDPSIKVKSDQVVFARKLNDIKQKYGSEIILIPFAGDLNLTSIDLFKGAYSINSYPVVIVNEKYIIQDVEELDKIESILQDNK